MTSAASRRSKNIKLHLRNREGTVLAKIRISDPEIKAATADERDGDREAVLEGAINCLVRRFSGKVNV
jgi:hypothetical protein